MRKTQGDEDMNSTMKNLCAALLFATIVGIAPKLASACTCVESDVIQGPYSCYNPSTGCGKTYNWNGCNCQELSDFHCVNIRTCCCGLYTYPDTDTSRPCFSAGGQGNCKSGGQTKSARITPLPVDPLLDPPSIGQQEDSTPRSKAR